MSSNMHIKNVMVVAVMSILIISTIFSSFGLSNIEEEDQIGHEKIDQEKYNSEKDNGGTGELDGENHVDKSALYSGMNKNKYDFKTGYGLDYEKDMPSLTSTNWSFNDPHRLDKVLDMGYSGQGVDVAIADTGVDFGHPDLNNSYKVIENESSPYHGWPMAFDPMSMNTFLDTASPEGTHYIDTSTVGHGPFELPHTIDVNGLNDFFNDERIGSSGGESLGSNGDWDLNRLYSTIDEEDWFFGFNTYYGAANRTYAFYIDEDGPASGGVTDPRGHLIDFESSHSNEMDSIEYNSIHGLIYTTSRGVQAAEEPEDLYSIRVWSEDGTLTDTVKDHGDRVLALELTPDETKLASMDQEKCFIRDAETLEEELTIESDFSDRTNLLSFSPNGSYLASVSSSNRVQIYDIAGNFVKEIGGVGTPTDIEFNPVDGDLLAIGRSDGSSIVKNITDGSNFAESPERHNGDVALRWMPDALNLLTVGDANSDNIVYMWDTGTETITDEYQLFSTAFIDDEDLSVGNLIEGEPDFSNTTANDDSYRVVEETGTENHKRLNSTYTMQFPSGERPPKDFVLRGNFLWNDTTPTTERCDVYIYNYESGTWEEETRLYSKQTTDSFDNVKTTYDKDTYCDDLGRVLVRFIDENVTGTPELAGKLFIDSLLCTYDLRMSTVDVSDDGGNIIASTETGEIHILNETLELQNKIDNPKGYETQQLAFAGDNKTVLSATAEASLRKWDVDSHSYTMFYQNKPDYVIYTDYIRKIDDTTGDLFRDPKIYRWNETIGDWDGPMSLREHDGGLAYDSAESGGSVESGFAEMEVPRKIFDDADSLALEMALVKTDEPSRAIDASPTEFNLKDYYDIHGGGEDGRDHALGDSTPVTLSNLNRKEMPKVEVDESIGEGPYHFGTHTSELLRETYGDIGVIVHEGNVYVDLNQDYVIDGDDAMMNKENPVGTIDLNDDGIADVSAGMLYFNSDAKLITGEELVIDDEEENIAELEHDNLVSFPNRVVVYKNGEEWDEVTETKTFQLSSEKKIAPFIEDEEDIVMHGEFMPVENLTVFESVEGEEEGFDLPHHDVIEAGELVEDYTIHDLSLYRSPEMVKIPAKNYTLNKETGEVKFRTSFIADYPKDIEINAFYNYTGKLLEDDYEYDSEKGDIRFTHGLWLNSTVNATYTFKPYKVDKEEGNVTITGEHTSEDMLTIDYQYDGKPLPYSDILAEEKDIDFVPTAGRNDMIALIGDFTWDSIEGEAETHGTRIASTITSSGSLDPSNGKIKGAAPGTKIIPIANADKDLVNSWRFATHGYDGVTGTEDDSQVVYTAPKLDTYETGFDTFSQNLNDISKKNPSTIFITGIGDDGYGYGTALSPTSTNALVTGASTYEIDSAGNVRYMQIPSYSSRGPTSSGKIKPDLIAVGTGYVDLPLGVRGEDGSSSYTSRPWSSTELSAGVVTGIAALVYESYNDTNGVFPTGEEVRNIMLSSSHDMGYDVFTQGSGFIDALDCIKLSTNSSGLKFSDNWWEPGDYHGDTYSSFPNFVEPGKNYTKEINITNLGGTEEVSVSSNIFKKVGEDELTFDASSNEDYEKIITDYIPYDSSSLRVTVSTNSNSIGSDDDPNRLTIYDWHDDDYSGTVDSGELEPINECRLPSSTLQVSASDPMREIEDGLVVGFETSVTDSYEYEIKMEYFSYSDMEWISTNNIDTITDEEVLNLSMQVPEDVEPGTYDSSVIVNHDLKNQPETELFNVTKYDVENESHDGEIKTLIEDPAFFGAGNATGKLSEDTITWVYSHYNRPQVVQEVQDEWIKITDQVWAYWLGYNESDPRFDSVSVSRVDFGNIGNTIPEAAYTVNETTGWVEVDFGSTFDPTGNPTYNWYNTTFDYGNITLDRYNGEVNLEYPLPADSFIRYNYSYLDGGRFDLANENIVEGNLTFEINETVVPESNYTVDHSQGIVYLTSPIMDIHETSRINFTYSYASGPFDGSEVVIPQSIYHPRYYKEGSLTVNRYPWYGGEEILSDGDDYTFERYNRTIVFTEPLEAGDALSVTYDYYNRSKVIPVVAHISAYGSRYEFNSQNMDTPFLSGGLMGGGGADTKKSGDWRYYYLDIPKQGKYSSPPDELKFMVDGDWSVNEVYPPRSIFETEKATNVSEIFVEDDVPAVIEGDGYINTENFEAPEGNIRDIRIGVKYRSTLVNETKKQDKMKVSFKILGENFDKTLEVTPKTTYRNGYIDITRELGDPTNVSDLEVKIEHDQYANSDGWELLVDHVWLDVVKSTATTDMDIHVLNELDQPIGDESPYTLGHKVGSDEDDEFFTNTGESQEIVSSGLVPGLNVIAVHNTILNKTTSHDVDVQTSTLDLTDTKLDHYTNHLSGNAEIGMTWNTERYGYGGSVVGPGDEEEYPDQVVMDDDTSGITTYESWNRAMIERSSYTKVVTLENALSWDVHIQGHDNAPDLDLGLVYDANGDGKPQFDELITPDFTDYESYADSGTGPYATCADADADERVKLFNPPDGDYIICVYGWTVMGDEGNFDLSMTTILAGVKGYEAHGHHPDITEDELGEYVTKTHSEPYQENGLNVTWAFSQDTNDGEYGGVMKVGPSEVPDMITVPVVINLDTKGPRLKDETPAEGSTIPYSTPIISMSYSDESGIDLNSFELKLDGENITYMITPSSKGFAFMPEEPLSDGSHYVELNITDVANNTVSKTWSFEVDTESPYLQFTDELSDYRGETIYTRDNSFKVGGIFSKDTREASISVSHKYHKESKDLTLTDNEFEYDVDLEYEGEYEITIESRDAADNQKRTTVYLNKDTTKPEITILKPSSSRDSLVKKDSAKVEGVIEGESGRTDVEVNRESMKVYNDGSFGGVIDLKEGENILQVRAIDEAGNEAWMNITISKDTSPPVFTWSYELTGDQAVITGEIDEDGRRVYVNGGLARINDGSFEETITLREGSVNEVTVTAEDELGNLVQSQKVIDLSGETSQEVEETEGSDNMLVASILWILAALLFGIFMGFWILPKYYGEEEPEELEPEEFDEFGDEDEEYIYEEAEDVEDEEVFEEEEEFIDDEGEVIEEEEITEEVVYEEEDEVFEG
ncbi:MAG: S8 family serine peptidase [Thermoplasmatota archaeon]